MKFKPGQLVRIEWVDSCAPTEQGWVDPDELDTRVSGIETVGWVHVADDKSVTVVHSVDRSSGNVNGAMTIPLVAITATRRLDK